ncbi:MAG: hypothetical protein PHS44_03125 [Candidatus Dojkabacteria bacterium]|nr:hypothetical protein [Candidatus Dojkabacteria bacterium]
MKDLKKAVGYLFISKVRVKVLRLFFLHPDVPYHIRGVVREVGEEINAVRRELLRLEQIQLLKSERKGNRLYFTLVDTFPFFDELLSIVYKTYGLGGEIIRCQKELGDVKYAFLTKSYTKGIKTGMQDIDLLLIGKVNVSALTAAVQRAERQTGREINYTVLKDSEFILRKKRRDVFVLGMLSGSKVMLIGDEDELVL